jgi:hypothetical protein
LVPGFESRSGFTAGLVPVGPGAVAGLCGGCTGLAGGGACVGGFAGVANGLAGTTLGAGLVCAALQVPLPAIRMAATANAESVPVKLPVRAPVLDKLILGLRMTNSFNMLQAVVTHRELAVSVCRQRSQAGAGCPAGSTCDSQDLIARLFLPI